jgi:hypothetical protein
MNRAEALFQLFGYKALPPEIMLLEQIPRH